MKLEEILDLKEEELDDYLIWIDHREEEESIIEGVAEVTGCDLSCVWVKDKLITKFNNESIEFPYTISCHDRYVAISSLAELLKAEYEFWLLSESFDGDTHGLLVIKKEELTSSTLPKLKVKYEKLELGVDYFSGLEVPYLHNEDNNPNLMEQSEDMETVESEAMESFVSSPEVHESIDLMKEELGAMKSKPALSWKKALLIGLAIFIVLRILRSVF